LARANALLRPIEQHAATNRCTNIVRTNSPAIAQRNPPIRVISATNAAFTGDPVGRSSSRRAWQFFRRADQLAKQAEAEHDPSERCFLRDQAEIYRRVADAIAPTDS
jgi:hypothetical protein